MVTLTTMYMGVIFEETVRKKMSLIPESKLDFWIKNNYNVILKGAHGVGKTHLITSAFERNDLNWVYFSASTMDPWVDFIGVPKEKTDTNGNSYLELIRPKIFQDDEVEAIFLDEFNRAPKKVKNAVMELLQFKSINGRKFKNLKIIWAAINPDDGDDDDVKYDVEPMDPAQLDRFHIIYDTPYRVDSGYLQSKYDSIGSSAASWWRKLPDNIKKKISPRRLDYALDVYKNGGDLNDVIDKSVGVKSLLDILNNGTIEDRLKTVYSNSDTITAESMLADVNLIDAAFKIILKNTEYLRFYHTFIPKDYLISKITGDMKVAKVIIDKLEPDFLYDSVRSFLKLRNKRGQFEHLTKWIEKLEPPKLSSGSPPVPLLEYATASNTYKRFKAIELLKEDSTYNSVSKEEVVEAMFWYFAKTQEATIKHNSKDIKSAIKKIYSKFYINDNSEFLLDFDKVVMASHLTSSAKSKLITRISAYT